MTADPYQLPETGHVSPPPSRPRGVVVVALCVFAFLALGIAVAVWVTR